MVNRFIRKAAFTVSAFTVACVATGALAGADVTKSYGNEAAPPAAQMSPPLENWSAPQTLNVPRGVSATPSMNLATGTEKGPAKTVFTLSSLVPVTPCRLVDTRGLFSPVYAGGPYTAGETRNYIIPTHCGVPAGTNHVKAVSLQVTTPPTTLSGDIEVIATGQVLGGTVAMVMQSGLWNSVSITPGVNSAGSIQVQLRGTPGDVVIDLNGYYANLNSAQDDVFSISGTHNGGGVLFVTNADAGGSAINAINSNTFAEAQLAFGDAAILVDSGAFRVTGAGVGSGTMAYILSVNTADYPTGNRCSLGNANFIVLDHPMLNGDANAIPVATARNGSGIPNPVTSSISLWYQSAASFCTSAAVAGKWMLKIDSGTAAVANSQYNIVIFKSN